MSKFIVITALSENYRRAGLVFGTEPTEYKAEDFDKDTLDALYADKNLTIKDAPQLVDNDLVEINQQLASENERLTIELGQATGQIVSLEEQVAELNDDLHSIEIQNADLKEEIVQLKESAVKKTAVKKATK